jgi:hypothetical protein
MSMPRERSVLLRRQGRAFAAWTTSSALSVEGLADDPHSAGIGGVGKAVMGRYRQA